MTHRPGKALSSGFSYRRTEDRNAFWGDDLDYLQGILAGPRLVSTGPSHKQPQTFPSTIPTTILQGRVRRGSTPDDEEQQVQYPTATPRGLFVCKCR